MFNLSQSRNKIILMFLSLFIFFLPTQQQQQKSTHEDNIIACLYRCIMFFVIIIMLFHEWSLNIFISHNYHRERAYSTAAFTTAQTWINIFLMMENDGKIVKKRRETTTDWPAATQMNQKSKMNTQWKWNQVNKKGHWTLRRK